MSWRASAAARLKAASFSAASRFASSAFLAASSSDCCFLVPTAGVGAGACITGTGALGATGTGFLQAEPTPRKMSPARSAEVVVMERVIGPPEKGDQRLRDQSGDWTWAKSPSLLDRKS